MSKYNIPDEEIVAMYLSGKTTKEISVIFNTCSNTILNRLHKKGIRIRQADENNRKYHLNDNYFETINSEDKAYFLGLLYADGCVRNNGFEFSLSGEEDTYIVGKFNSYLESTYPVNKKLIEGHKTVYRLSVSSKKIMSDLIKLGCVPRKSLIISLPSFEKVPEILFHHFVRGYFDGDGSVSFKKDGGIHYSIISSVVFINGLIDYLKKYNLEFVSRTDDNKSEFTAYISAGGVTAAKKFYNLIYKDATLFLNRKKNVFDSYFDIYPKNLNERLFAQPESHRKEICDLFGVEYTVFMKSKLPNDKQLEIIEEYLKVRQVKSIALKFGYSKTMVQNVLKNHNVYKKKTLNGSWITEEEQNRIIELYKSGKSLDAVAKLTRHHLISVRNIITNTGNLRLK